MLIRIPRPWDVKPSEITDERIYRARREFMKTAAVAGAGLALSPSLVAAKPLDRLKPLSPIVDGPYSTDEEATSYKDITSYNNFYEFGYDKSDPARYAPKMKVDPWTVEVAGEAEVTGKFAFEDLVKPFALQERTYRFRCVEAWSMVVPWVGFPLADLIKRFKPTSKAKFVEFTTLYDPTQMPGQRLGSTMPWPYNEGLRMDEAMNPLTLMVVGLYGKELPGQDGAPIRLIVPWKYGFKSIKSIVRINFRETQPRTTWHTVAGNEYGFYANVNPNVDHPRWSQARERRIGDFFKRDTLMFNGYGEQVAHLYKGMDLHKYF